MQECNSSQYPKSVPLAPPAVLHKYFHRDAGIAFLADGNLRLACPTDFNDPFELLPGVESAVADELRRSALKGVLKGLEIILPFPFLPISLLSSAIFNGSIKDRQYGVSPVFRKKLASFFRIACFCESDDNLLLWAHYARRHTGLVVSFRTSMDYWGNDFYPVVYSNDRIQVPSGFMPDPSVPLVDASWQRQLLATKSSCWSYEREWRYIKRTQECAKNEQGNYVQIAQQCVTRVVYGCRFFNEDSMPDEKQSICIKVQKRWPAVKQFWAQPDPITFSLVLHDISVPV